MFFDLPLDQLEAYKPERTEPDDFDAFWASTLQAAQGHPLALELEPVDIGLRTVACFDVTFAGFGGHPIKGWFLRPVQATAELPCVVEFIGYGGGRGFALDWLAYSAAGFAHLVMDTRGQGSVWRKGDTPDPIGSAPQLPGFMTRGLERPDSYYYRRVFTDAVRAVAAAREAPGVNPSKIAVTGGSQGGGIALAVAGLVPDLAAAAPDVPFLCHYRRATAITDADPYGEISRYLAVHRDKVESAFHTLSYFDGLNFAARAKAPALFSAGLMDEICPPSTVWAAFNYYAAEKRLIHYTYNHHEGGDSFHTLEKLKFLHERLD